ncbi:MAG: InlB B-repeat-containing protein [Corallococcus sp.]|nr:InlB B-repeat-containing protein [Corallococcus sp.]MCM1359577.1 InlB B-repeat-containing protein [Corallococcus sp.]MCM1395169.1 InlB B-repeat-containing protein [Corallococcus sp.]
MKNKTFKILVAIFVFATLALVLVACGPQDQSLDGLYVVTFDFDGGKLYNGSTNIYNEIHHAYEPNSKIIDIAHYKNYEFTKSVKVVDGDGNGVLDDNGNQKYDYYDFDGWYLDKEHKNPWNFQTDKITVEKLTLYAKWTPRIKYTYDLFYTDRSGVDHRLGSYSVAAGAKFNDSNKYAVNGLTSAKKTFVNFYSDKELNTPWNSDFVHPGGDTDTSVPVYASWLDGVWKLVSDFKELQSAFGAMTDITDGIWLTADIDCGGETLYVDKFDNTLRGDNGSGSNYKISNFAIEGQSVRGVTPRYSIFGTLGANANICDVDFENVEFVFENLRMTATPQIAALAQTVEVSDESTCVVKNVNISGTYENKNFIEIENLDMENMSAILANLVVQQDAVITVENVTSTFAEKAKA